MVLSAARNSHADGKVPILYAAQITRKLNFAHAIRGVADLLQKPICKLLKGLTAKKGRETS